MNKASRPLPGGLTAIGAAVGLAYNGRHDGTHNAYPCPFTPQEREYIRRELDMFFGTLPSVAEGFQLRTWRGGPLAGQPKVPPPVRTMVERGLRVCQSLAGTCHGGSRVLGVSLPCHHQF